MSFITISQHYAINYYIYCICIYCITQYIYDGNHDMNEQISKSFRRVIHGICPIHLNAYYHVANNGTEFVFIMIHYEF